MTHYVQTFGALLTSLSLLLAGIGLQNTLIGLRAGLEGFSTATVGIMMSGYFLGYIVGCLAGPRLIIRAGHIRTFAMLASLNAAVAVMLAILPSPLAWTLLRFVTGFAMAGLYLVVESWLNATTTAERRGGMIAVYLVINLGSIAVGQQLVTTGDPARFELFAISSMLLSLAVLPVAVTRAQAPAPPVTPRLDIARIYAVSPAAFTGTLAAGLTNGAFWGMAPTYGLAVGLDTPRIANFMSIVVVGGILLQWPLGRLSDFTDRRVMLIAIAAALAVVAVGFDLVDPIAERPLFLALSLVYGGLLLTIYSICSAHANDMADPGEAVTVAGGLLLVYGIGAMAGPALAAAAMTVMGARAIFDLTAVTMLVFVLFSAWRLSRRAAPPEQQTAGFEPVPASLAPPIPQPAEADAEHATAER